MSDPEDVQSDEDQNISTGEWIYQLRRIGPPATLAKMPDVMRLNLGLTKIGRGQHNDYILDSAVLKNFISRSHVEIYGKKNENGEIEFVLTDKGLNGTFINDIRTHKTCTMEVGNKITFGHTNGYKIQPGSYAEQSQSEFQFQFEKVPRNSKTTEMFSEVLQPTHTPVSEERPEIIPDLKKDTTIVERQFLSDLKPNLQSQEKSAKSRTSQKGRSRRDSYSSSDNDIDTSKNSVKEKKRNSNDSNSKSPVLESGSSRKTSSGKGVFSETLPAQDDDFSDEIEDEEEVSEDEMEKKKKKGPKKGKASIHKKPVVKRKVPDPPSESEESSEEDESSKPEADQRPKSHTQASKLKQPKKKKVGNDAPAVGSRKRRRKGGAAPSSTATTSSELEPGVEWYEDDTCDSPDCKRPKKKKTPWVQCDDCDGWYHTMCVGANYNKLKDSDEHFNCGCE